MSISDQDLNKWNTWKKDPSSNNLSSLVKQMNPVIFKAVQINQGSLSPAVIEAEAKLQAFKAFKTYDPSKNVKLSTHLTNQLQKVSRLNYKYQELYKVPEDRRIKFNTFNSVKDTLKDSMGRDPTTEELASNLGWSNAEIKRYASEERSELSTSLPYSSDIGSYDTADETLLAYIYHDLDPQQKLVLEYVTGYNGRKRLSNSEIKNKLGITQGQLSYMKGQFTQKIKDARGRGII